MQSYVLFASLLSSTKNTFAFTLNCPYNSDRMSSETTSPFSDHRYFTHFLHIVSLSEHVGKISISLITNYNSALMITG